MDTGEGEAVTGLLGADLDAGALATGAACDEAVTAGAAHGGEMAAVEGGAADLAGTGTERGSDGSFGDGRVQANLDSWLL